MYAGASARTSTWRTSAARRRVGTKHAATVFVNKTTSFLVWRESATMTTHAGAHMLNNMVTEKYIPYSIRSCKPPPIYMYFDRILFKPLPLKIKKYMYNSKATSLLISHFLPHVAQM